MKLSKRPEAVNILGRVYSIEYVDNPAEVDLYKRKSLWGQIDYWTRTIRVYDNGKPDGDVWETVLHEVVHGIVTDLNLDDVKLDEDTVGLLALALTDTLVRNGWLGEGGE